MKKVTLLLVLIILTFAGTYAQGVPQGMKYQAVARNLIGSVIANQEISLKISLLTEGTHASVYYTEVHTVTTNQLGLFTLVVGEGKVEKGSFKSIPWSTEDVWMEVALKDKGKLDFVKISNSKLFAVPYAFHAATASKLVSSVQSPIGSRVDAGVPSANWSLKGNRSSDAAVDKLGTTDYKDLVIVTNNIDRLRITADGNINLRKSLSVGENLDVALSATFNKLGGTTTSNGAFTVDKSSPTTLTGTLAVGRATTLSSTLGVTGATTLGSTLGVAGATTLSSTLGVAGVTNLNNTLNVNNASATNLSGQLSVTGVSLLKGALQVDGAAYLNSTLNVTDDAILKSDLTVKGASTLEGSLAVTGETTLSSTVNANGQVNITANLTGGQSAKAAYPLTVQGSEQGIAVSVTGTGQNNKNFITFWDATAVKGRIEGQTKTELQSSFEYIWTNVLGAFDIALPTAEAIACGAQLDLAEVATNTTAAGVATANMIEYNKSLLEKLGVAYESGNGDYAEWLEKKNASEKFSYGDIVGVKGGKISKNTIAADHLMVVSMAPIVLGNMPAIGGEANFEKVAFMGQVPVKVWGKVTIGDYIIPSGSNDGFGYAVSSDNMTFELFAKVVGRAWSSAEKASGFTMINVAVGLTTNELASKISGQQKVIDDLRNQVATITAYLAAKDPAFKSSSTLPVAKVALNTSVAAKLIQTQSVVLAEQSKYLDLMVNTAKEICLKNGIDINKYDQIRRLFNDKKYLIETLQKN